MQITTSLYFQYAALSLLIVGGLVASASWVFVVKSADAAARAWFAAVAMQIMSGMVLFAAGTEWREATYFGAVIILLSSLYITLYSISLTLKANITRYLFALWVAHILTFTVLNKALDQQETSFLWSMATTAILEVFALVSLRRIRTRMQVTATLFAEIAFGAAIIGSLARLSGSLISGHILLYTELSIYSVVAMSLQCVLIVMSCFYYIGVSIQRAEARELEMRLEAAQLRVRQKMSEDHASEMSKLVAERDRMMILNSRFSAMSTLSLLGAGVVHEISQPLQAARSAMDVLAMQKELSSGDLAQQSAGVLRLIDRTSNVVENLRRLMREKSINQEAVDLERVLSRIFPIFLSEAQRRSIEATCTIDSSAAGKLVRANPVMLERIMFNLAANAFEAFDETSSPPASGSGERKLTVDVRSVDSDAGSDLVVGFHDTGKGIADAAHDKMFELLMTDKADGTGLGLYLVKTFIESWDGSVKADKNRRDQRGTSIEITLPVMGSR